MGETAHNGLAIPGRVVLAHETAFTLAGCRVCPSTREIEIDGTRETVEPRIMQVLVVLARARGQVVGRDELIQMCWDGRVVGDDAINRVIWRLRHMLERICPEQVRLETIPRVGYRLVAPDHAEPMSVPVGARQHGVVRAVTTRRSVIAGTIVGAGTLLTGVLAWTGQEGKHSPLPEARRHFDRAIELRGQMSVGQSEQSIAYLKEATRIDPQYAEAWGALAWGYRGLLEYGPRPDSDQLLLFARSAAERALELDPSNADARIAILLLEPVYGRWEQVEQGFRQILASHPTHGITEFNLAFLLAETGQWTAAVELFQGLAAREPFWLLVRCRLCDALLNAGRLDEAGEQLASALRLWPGRFELGISKVNYLIHSGRKAEAVEFANSLSGHPAEAEPIVELLRTISKAIAGGSAEQRQRARQMITRAAQHGNMLLWLTAPYSALLGELDLALAIFEGYFFDRGPLGQGPVERRNTFALFMAGTKGLREDSRFPALVREIGLERYWQSTGNLPDYLRRG